MIEYMIVGGIFLFIGITIGMMFRRTLQDIMDHEESIWVQMNELETRIKTIENKIHDGCKHKS